MAADPTKLKVAKDLGRQDILFALSRRKGSERVFVGGSDFKLYDVDLAAAKPEFPKPVGEHDELRDRAGAGGATNCSSPVATIGD